jgi:hypothetical protein
MDERVRRLECRTLAPGEAMLLIQGNMPTGGDEEQTQALEGPLDVLALTAPRALPSAG